MFVSEILSPECVFLKTETDFGQKHAALYVLRSPKFAKMDKNPILGLLLACYQILRRFDKRLKKVVGVT